MLNTWLLKLRTCSSKTTTTSSSSSSSSSSPSHNNIPLQLILPRNIFKTPTAREDYNPNKTHMMKKSHFKSTALFYNFHIYLKHEILAYLCIWSLTNNKQNKSKHTNKQTNKQAKTKHTKLQSDNPLVPPIELIQLHSNWSGDEALQSSCCKASYSSRKKGKEKKH
jgi:hypothetical protein